VKRQTQETNQKREVQAQVVFFQIRIYQKTPFLERQKGAYQNKQSESKERM
jgi:hypothetical protein